MKNEPVITITNLAKSFGSHNVLQGINLVLNKGENLAVLGKSGTGKSVLIKCIVRLITPDRGQIDALGTDVLAAGSEAFLAIRRKIGFLFQSAALYDSMTVRENLEFPLVRHNRKLRKPEIDHRVREALRNVGLEDAIHKMPSELSGGMRKRIGLARTLILEPEVVLYDEPTTGLDPVTSGEISELINEVREKFNTSSIIITHDMACVRATSDRIVMLKDGVVYREGRYEELSGSEDSWIGSFFKN